MSDPVTRLNAALEGRYAIERELGEGGMATVYLADDLKHGRKVALKVLKPELAAVVGAERFLAEIKTTAHLQHPHILPLFDSGEADSFLFYVMPYVEGESLRERLDHEHQLPVEEAVRIAVGVASALDYAHRQGVIHRDVKPANLLIHDGQPVVSDFGIALAVSAGGGSRLTETGLSMGTPHYMSPEQATGDQHVGAATDIYALGCVLYEMLVGEPPYTGSTPQAILGRIITGQPESVSEQRKSVPANVDAAVTKALEKLPADRFATAAALVNALGDATFHTTEPGVSAGADSFPWRNRTLLATALAAVFLIAGAWGWLRSPPGLPVSRLVVALPAEQGMEFQSNRSRLAIAPNGSFFVYSGPAPNGEWQLWLRRFDDLNASPIPGTERGYNPFFSPDGSRLGFAVGGMTLRVVSLSGGPPVTVADSVVGSAGTTWGSDGYLYADGSGPVSLYRVRPFAGAEPEPASTLDTARGETNHLWPEALPNGRGVVFTIDYGGNQAQNLAALDLATGTHHVLIQGAFSRYSPTGHIIYVTAGGTLMAVPFDQDELTLIGDPVAIAEGLDLRTGDAADVAISHTGTLMYTTRPQLGEITELVWVDRSGSITVIERSEARLSRPALSPDGTCIAVGQSVAGRAQVWIKQLPEGPFSQFTLLGGSGPAWTPDGLSLAFGSRRIALSDLFVREADGTAEATLLQDGTGLMSNVSYSPDQAWIVYWEDGTIYAAEVGADIGDRVSLESRIVDYGGVSISPNGRWVAYASAQSGESEVYVAPAPFPDESATRWLVGAGSFPVWARSGTELFYRSGDGVMVAAQVLGGPSFGLGRQEELFSMSEYVGQFDVDLDAQRFVMVRQLLGVTLTPNLVVVQNFFEELKERVPN